MLNTSKFDQYSISGRDPSTSDVGETSVPTEVSPNTGRRRRRRSSIRRECDTTNISRRITTPTPAGLTGGSKQPISTSLPPKSTTISFTDATNATISSNVNSLGNVKLSNLIVGGIVNDLILISLVCLFLLSEKILYKNKKERNRSISKNNNDNEKNDENSESTISCEINR